MRLCSLASKLLLFSEVHCTHLSTGNLCYIILVYQCCLLWLFTTLLFTEEKNYRESVRLMRHLLTVSPAHLLGKVQLATSLMELGESQTEAKDLFNSALLEDPHHVQALRHLGRSVSDCYCCVMCELVCEVNSIITVEPLSL